jgi:hypothetical protein
MDAISSYVHDPYSFGGWCTAESLYNGLLQVTHHAMRTDTLCEPVAFHNPSSPPILSSFPTALLEGQTDNTNTKRVTFSQVPSPSESIKSSPTQRNRGNKVAQSLSPKPVEICAFPQREHDISVKADMNMGRMICTHFAKWRQLRIKKGLSHMFCSCCGMKWKTKCLPYFVFRHDFWKN